MVPNGSAPPGHEHTNTAVHRNPTHCTQVNLAEAEEKHGDKLSGWRLRVALAEGAAAVMRTDPKLMSPEVLEAALSCISGLLADDSYAARLAGGRLVQVGLECGGVQADSVHGLLCCDQ